MNVQEKVTAVLAAAAGVTNLVPVTRIKPPGDQQRLTVPYIVHFPVSCQTGETHDTGLINLKYWLYQVSCFDASYSAAKKLAAQVVLALGNCRGPGNISSHYSAERTMPYEGDVKIQQIVLEFEIWESL